MEWTNVLQKYSCKLLWSENAKFFLALENELLKLQPLPIVMMKELPLSQHVPIFPLFPSVTERGRKDMQFTVPLIPTHLFPFISLMRAHCFGIGPWRDWTKIFSLKFCNYVLLVSHYCFAHIIRRTGSITMQQASSNREKVDATRRLHKWRMCSLVEYEAPLGK